jgi:hypothetical protein
MRISVDTAVNEAGLTVPRRIRRGESYVDVAETVDQWHGPDYRYLKVIGADGHTYILRHDEVSGEWDLTLFQRS